MFKSMNKVKCLWKYVGKPLCKDLLAVIFPSVTALLLSCGDKFHSYIAPLPPPPPQNVLPPHHNSTIMT